MTENEIKIKATTEGLEEAAEEIREMADAISSFPSAIQIRKIEGCEVYFNIYQTITKEG